MTIGIISHPDCLLHEMGKAHPECPDRIRVIQHALETNADLLPHLKFYQAKPARTEDIKAVHDPEYVDFILQAAPKSGYLAIDPDTMMNPHTLRAALLAVGSGIQAVDLVMEGKVNQVFCNVRPPGHHAERANGMGFCFFNNVAVAVHYALTKYQMNKIAIVDFDVHHGNGTEDFFQNESRVLLLSSYQHPFYPYRGIIQGNPHLMHLPLPARTNGQTYRTLVERFWLPAIDQFAPQFIFFSAGFDAHRLDLLAELQFETEDYYWISRKVYELAEKHCQARIVSCLEGGYALEALGPSVVAHLSSFID